MTTHGRHADLLVRLRAVADEVAAGAGVEVVEIGLRGSSRRRVLRVDIDRAGAETVGIQDCERVSRALEQALDETELLQGGYVLEVSSPGVDRPIDSDDDIRRNTGRRIVVHTTEPLEGERCFRGLLLGGEPEALRLLVDDRGEFRIPRNAIERAQQDVGF